MKQNNESHKMTMRLIAGYYGNRPRRWRLIWKELEIEHYGLQDCEKEEVTDDGTK